MLPERNKRTAQEHGNGHRGGNVHQPADDGRHDGSSGPEFHRFADGNDGGRVREDLTGEAQEPPHARDETQER